MHLLCSDEALYLKYATINKSTEVKVPLEEKVITKMVKKYKIFLNKIDKKINNYLSSFIPNQKLREKVKERIWTNIITENYIIQRKNNRKK